MYSPYMSYESAVSLCQAASITTTLWFLLDALSSSPVTLAGTEENPTTGAGVPVTCCAGAWCRGRLAANMGATHNVSISKSTWILQSWQ